MAILQKGDPVDILKNPLFPSEVVGEGIVEHVDESAGKVYVGFLDGQVIPFPAQNVVHKIKEVL